MKTLYEEMYKAGLITGNHYSDLYTLDTPEARAIANRHEFVPSVFIDQVTGKRSLDFFGQYSPYWETKRGREQIARA